MATVVRRINRHKTFEVFYIIVAIGIYLGYRQWQQNNLLIAILLWVQTLLTVYVVDQTSKEPEKSAYDFVHSKKDRRGPTLVCLGDSITHARCSSDWVSTIQPTLSRPLNVVNNGQNSITTYTTLQERVDWTLACEPDYVVILIGTNDARALVDWPWHWLERACWGLPGPITETSIEANLKGIVEKLLKKHNLQVAICTIPPLGEDLTTVWNQRAVKNVNACIRKVASSAGSRVTLLDLYGALESKIRQSAKTNSSAPSFFWGHVAWQTHGKQLFQLDWNDMSRWIGNVVLTDAIHLNDTGGVIMNQLVVHWLLQQEHF